ncbi:MAG TPA: hypothetical protein VGC31_07440, partial [Paenirhodobacter sp.]
MSPQFGVGIERWNQSSARPFAVRVTRHKPDPHNIWCWTRDGDEILVKFRMRIDPARIISRIRIL